MRGIVGNIVQVIAGLTFVLSLLFMLCDDIYLLRLEGAAGVLIALAIGRLDQARRHHDALMAAITESRRPLPEPIARVDRTAQPAQPRPKRIDDLLEQIDNR